MPRKPTGRPRGRPAGTGQLDNPKRITVWLSGETYDKLEAYADGRHYHRGEPQLAVCMRELLMHALACPYKNQTQNIPQPYGDNNRPIENVLAVTQNISEQIETITAAPENNYYEQTGNVPLVTENISRQIENIPEVIESDNGQIENVPATAQPPRQRTKARATVLQAAQNPALAHVTDTVTVTDPSLAPFDTTKFYLGKLCPRGHDYYGTGLSLLRKHNQHCRECENESRREGRARKKAEQEAATV